LHLNTTGWKSGKRHEIEIWFVQYNDKYYIMSERLNRAHWVQNIMQTFEGNGRIIDNDKESKLAAEVSNLMDKK
jgi:hypothetical protein